MMDRDGRASGVLFYRDNLQPAEQGARVVVVAAGAIESARLLLLSARESKLAGRLNQSGQVGRNFMLHHIWPMILKQREPVYNGRVGAAMAHSYQFLEPPDRRKHGGSRSRWRPT